MNARLDELAADQAAAELVVAMLTLDPDAAFQIGDTGEPHQLMGALARWLTEVGADLHGGSEAFLDVARNRAADALTQQLTTDHTTEGDTDE